MFIFIKNIERALRNLDYKLFAFIEHTNYGTTALTQTQASPRSESNYSSVFTHHRNMYSFYNTNAAQSPTS